MNAIRSLLLLGMTVSCSRPAVVVLFVDDPDGLAVQATALRVRSDDGHEVRRTTKGHPYPVSLTLTSERPHTSHLVIEALDAAGTPVARAWGMARFRLSRDDRLNVELGAACERADDGSRCARSDVEGAQGVCLDGTCKESACGDGFPDIPAEECDDGNDIDEDECRADCHLNECGDGFHYPALEECDDGNLEEEDDCLSSCLANVCGDGILNPLRELCDDDNLSNDDACLDDCTANICGDGHRNLVSEACDDGNVDSGDGCRSDCQKVESCGDSLLDVGEACDDGNDNDNDGCRGCAREYWEVRAVVGLDAASTAASSLDLGGGLSLATPLYEAGVVYIASKSKHTIWRIEENRAIVAAGTGGAGLDGDEVPGPAAELTQPSAIALDSAGHLYLAQLGTTVLRRVDAFTGLISTVSPPGSLQNVQHLTVDAAGYAYYFFAETGKMRRFDSRTGLIESFPDLGSCPCCDGVTLDGATVSADSPLAADTLGNVFFVDRAHNLIRRISFDNPHDLTTGTVTTVGGYTEGLDDDCALIRNHSTDPFNLTGGPGAALATALSISVTDVAVGPDGSVYLGEGRPDCNVRRFRPNGDVDFVLGNKAQECARADADAGSLAVGPDGLLYVTDLQTNQYVVVNPDTTEVLFVGGGASDGGTRVGHAARGQLLRSVDSIASTPNGDLYVAEQLGDRILRIDAEGILHDAVGTGFAGPAPPWPATVQKDVATLNEPGSLVWVDEQLTFVDRGNHTVRRMDRAGMVEIVAGDGEFSGTTPDGVRAAGWPLNDPRAIALDSTGGLYIAELDRVRYVDSSGLLATVVGGVDAKETRCGGIDAAGTVITPGALAVGPDDTLFVIDEASNVVCHVDPRSAQISSLVTDEITAQWGSLRDLSVDGGGGAATLWIADTETLWSVPLPQEIGNPAVATPWKGSDGAFGYGRYPSEFVAESLRTVHAAGPELWLGGGFPIESWVARLHPDLGVIGGVAGWKSGNIADGLFRVAALPGAKAITSIDAETILVATDRHLRRVDGGRHQVDTVAGYPIAVPHASDLARFSQTLGAPTGLASDGRGGAYVTSRDGVLFRFVFADPNHPEVDPTDPWTWRLETVAGGPPGHADGDATIARFSNPSGVTRRQRADGTEVLYVSDYGSYTVRAVVITATSTTVTTLAGTPFVQGLPRTEPVSSLSFIVPSALAVSPDGTILMIADAGAHRVIAVGLDADTGLLDPLQPMAHIILGAGDVAGEGAPAAGFRIGAPRALTFDPDGNLFVGAATEVLVVAAGADDRVTGADEMHRVFTQANRDNALGGLTGAITGLDTTETGGIIAVDENAGIVFELVATTLSVMP